MQLRFPKERTKWRAYVERLLTELRIDYDRLWKSLPPVPQPHGVPFSGPLNPVPFNWFPPEASGGTPGTGNSLCDATDICFELSGIAEGASGTLQNAVCDNLNQRYHCRKDGSCAWTDKTNSTWWAANNPADPARVRVTHSGTTLTLRFLTSQFGTNILQYTATGVTTSSKWPIRMTRTSLLFPIGCMGVPDTILVYDCSGSGSATQGSPYEAP